MLSPLFAAIRTPDLRKKILFVLGIIILYRLGATVPSPGVDYQAVQACLDEVSSGESSSVYSLINLFSGGALLQLSVFAIGIMPYITAAIIVQLLTVVIPRFEQLRKEGQAGQAKMTQYTRYLAVALALLQSTGIVALADRGQLLPQSCAQSGEVLNDQSIFGLSIIVLVMTAGACVVMWFGELITERGIGNGMSLLIFAGIAARIPAEGRTILNSRGGLVFALVCVAALIIVAGVGFTLAGAMLSTGPWRAADGYVGHSAVIQGAAVLAVAAPAVSVLLATAAESSSLAGRTARLRRSRSRTNTRTGSSIKA